eukprot:6425528-Amphidinium_carterae.1
MHNLPVWGGESELYDEFILQIRAYIGYTNGTLLETLDDYCAQRESGTDIAEDTFPERAQAYSRELFFLLALKTKGAAGLETRRHPSGQ